MITIYDSRETDFSTLGLCVLQPTECTIEGEENGMMELSMTHPMDKDGRWLNLAEYNIIRAPAPVRETPLIRVLDNPGASGMTATRTICKVKTYTGKRLRLRAKPSTSAKVLGYYAPGTEVVRLSVSGDWAQVVIVKGGASGWMSNERLQVVRTETENVSGSGTENVSKCIEPRQTREQLFRICEVETDDEAGLVYVTAKHIFYDLAYNTVKGDYSPDGAAVGEVCAQLLARALDPHDFTVYCTAEGTVTGDYGRKGIANCLLESEIGVADQTGAKIVLDNYDVFVLKDETRDNGVEIRHAKNMTGATLKKNVESTITRIVPVGKDENGDPLPLPNGEYVETPRAASIPVIHSKKIEYDVSVGKNEGEYKDNAAAYAKLRELAAADFADNALDAVTVGLDVDFVILENRHSESYAAYAVLQTIHMGDTVRVVSSRSGIDAKLRMTGFTYDAMYPNGGRYKKVRLGQLTDLKTQVYGFDIARGTTPGNKILPNSLDGQAALKNATIGYAKIAQAAIDQLSADSIVAVRAHISKLVAGNITTDQLYVDLAQIAVAQITTANINKANIGWAQIATLSAQIATIAQAQITTANIKNANIDWAQIAVIAAGSITADKLAAGSVTTDKLVAGAVTAEKIASKTITADLIKAKTITADSGIIDDSAIGTAQIADGSITSAKIVELNADLIQTGTLSAERLLLVGEDGVIYKINAASSGLSMTELAKDQYKNYINGTVIVAKSITAAQIAAQTITGNEILAGSVTAKEINVSDLFASEATINALNAMDIRGNKYLQLYVTDAVDNISVGGRNLLRNTNQGTVNWDWSMQTGGKTIEEYLDGGVRAVRMTRDATPHAGWSVISYAIGKDAYALLEPDAEYIVSMDYKSTVAAPNGISVNICTGEATDHAIQTATYDKAIPADEWTHIAVPIKTKSALPAFNYQLVYLTGFSSAVNSVHIFKNLKLEKGNKATDWSPAPEDIEERMSAAELKIEPDAIVSTVTSSASYKTLSSKADDNATDITGLKTRMTTAESKIDQKADSITLSVLETKVDGISVGGRNLLRGTNQGTVNWGWSMQTGGRTIEEYLDGGVRAVRMTRDAVEQTGWSIIGYEMGANDYALLKPNTEYTLSFDYKPSVATANGVMFSIRRGDGSNAATNDGGYWKEIPANEWTHISGTFTTVENIPDFLLNSTEIYITRLPTTVNSVHIFKNLKLEKGNKSTDWSPAPEDPAGSLSVSSDYSKVDINTERVRIVSKRMEVAVPSDDGEDDVLRVDADGVHAEVVEADRIVSDSVVHTHGAASYTPANAGELAAILEELSGKTLTGAVVINCANVTGGTVALSGIQAAGGRLEIDNGTFGEVTITDCQASVYFYGSIVENANLCIGIYRSQYVHFHAVKISGDLGLQLGYESNSGGVLGGNVIMISCTGNCYSLARLGYCSVLRMMGSSKPSGIIQCAAGSEVYNATPDPTFTAASSPSIPTTQTVTVSLSPTSTSTSGYGSKLYQGRYSSSQSLRKGVMLFSLPSDLTSADKIDSATLTIKRIGGVGQGGGVSAHVRCYDVPGTLYASKTVYENQTVSIDVTNAVKAMKTSGYTGLMLYNPDTTTAGSKSYTASYSRFAGKGESGAPVLKISYRK